MKTGAALRGTAVTSHTPGHVFEEESRIQPQRHSRVRAIVVDRAKGRSQDDKGGERSRLGTEDQAFSGWACRKCWEDVVNPNVFRAKVGNINQ